MGIGIGAVPLVLCHCVQRPEVLKMTAIDTVLPFLICGITLNSNADAELTHRITRSVL